VRIAFSSNDERTAKRISDALGTATELRAQRNYAGHRLSPWLGHVMVSRQETARPLLTPGEVMQLPPSDELLLISGLPPVRAKKLRYFEDGNFTSRVLPAPTLVENGYRDRPTPCPDDWTGQVRGTHEALRAAVEQELAEGEEEGGLQQQRLPDVAEEGASSVESDRLPDLTLLEDDADTSTQAGTLGRARAMNEGEKHHRRPDDDLLPAF
jgi:type IV secretion system protein VirD4